MKDYVLLEKNIILNNISKPIILGSRRYDKNSNKLYNSAYYLNENGKVYLEHAPDQYEELNKFAMENGYLNFSNLNDLNGDKRVSIYQC